MSSLGVLRYSTSQNSIIDENIILAGDGLLRFDIIIEFKERPTRPHDY